MSTRARRGALPPIEIQYHLPPEDLPLVDLLVTEDDKPVDNLFAEKQRRLLVDPLYAAWRGGPAARPFVAASDVGIFPAVREPPLAPDAFLSIDVRLAEPLDTRGRAYFFWEYGKPPDVAVEVVSNHKGGEITRKLQRYAQMGIPYYAIFDRANRLRRGMLRLFRLGSAGYEPAPGLWMPEVELGFTIWQGPYEEAPNIWLRWCDAAGQVYATGAELAMEAQRNADQARVQAEQERTRAEQERTRAEQERTRAEQERTRAEQERTRAEQLAARLRTLGIDPDSE
jgi:hypothetical protein